MAGPDTAPEPDAPEAEAPAAPGGEPTTLSGLNDKIDRVWDAVQDLLGRGDTATEREQLGGIAAEMTQQLKQLRAAERAAARTGSQPPPAADGPPKVQPESPPEEYRWITNKLWK